MAKTITTGFISDSVNGIKINSSVKSSSSNYNKKTSRSISYIVLHYTGNEKDTAWANANYFKNGSRGASAHFFVDNDNIYQSIALKDIAWHCGAKTYYHSACRNSNAIGIEMCCTAGNYKISSTTIKNAAYLTANLCKKLGISADDVDKYVLRHYDVTHKACPKQMSDGGAKDGDWLDFKKLVKQILGGESSSVTSSASKEIYRIRKSWADEKSQIGAYSNLNNAKKACDKAGGGYEVYNSAGKQVYPSIEFASYKVKINTAVLRVRSGPGTNYTALAAVEKGEVYTIVDKKGDWGLLKAGPKPGSSWIHLGYTKKI